MVIESYLSLRTVFVIIFDSIKPVNKSTFLLIFRNETGSLVSIPVQKELAEVISSHLSLLSNKTSSIKNSEE
jgi:hypothetical protein